MEKEKLEREEDEDILHTEKLKLIVINYIEFHSIDIYESLSDSDVDAYCPSGTAAPPAGVSIVELYQCYLYRYYDYCNQFSYEMLYLLISPSQY